MFITDETDLDELKKTPRLYGGYLWFQKSCDKLGRLPNRTEVNPVELSFALGYEMLTELHRDKNDAKFRLIGSVIEEFTGLGSSTKGSWYSEVFDNESFGKVMAGLTQIVDQKRPFFGVANFTRADGVDLQYARIVMPLSTLDGEPEMLFSIFSSIVEDGDAQASRDKMDFTLR